MYAASARVSEHAVRARSPLAGQPAPHFHPPSARGDIKPVLASLYGRQTAADRLGQRRDDREGVLALAAVCVATVLAGAIVVVMELAGAL